MGVEALRSFTSNAAGPSQHLQLPFFVDLVFSNAPLRARRVAASRGRRTKSTTTTRVISSHSASSPFSNRGLDHSCICRANSFDQSQGDLPERENQPDGGIKNQPDQGNGMESNTKVRLQFGSSSVHLDGFRRSSSLDFEDEFFTRMMALEASHRDGRACSTTFFENGATLGATPSTEPNSPEPLCALGMGGVQLPSSIKKLRRQNRSSLEQHPQGCAIKNAFSSMVYMIKAVQSHALQIRQVLFSEWDVQEVLHLVHREMHSSFVWLFQQVFACTPKLMVSVMLLLANFTVYSMGENVAIASTETPAPIAFFLSTYGNPQASLDPHFKTLAPRVSSSPRPGPSSGGNNNKPPPPSIAESFEGDGRALNVFSHRDSIRDAPLLEEDDAKMKKKMQLEMMKAWVESSMMELKSGEVPVHHHQVQLEQETIRRLVAPVVAHLESDNYACFDRTDLEYQHALSKDPSNSLLHANYAQFLYVVRHDHDRAESYFHRAMRADPLDSAILGRFASFLWLGRGNRSAAERAYKAAMAADPDSSFPASNYAHFLWHVGDGGESSLGPMAV